MRKQAILGITLLAGAGAVARRLRRDRRLRGLLEAHSSETDRAYQEAQRRVLILGAGFGGLHAALELDRQLRGTHWAAGTSILLADRNNDLLFAPLLWIVANSRANPSDVMVPVRAFQRGRRFHVLYADVTGINLEERVVRTTAGPRPYDYSGDRARQPHRRPRSARPAGARVALS